MKPTVILAKDLNDLWFESIKACFNPLQAKKYKIDEGSFVGQNRYQLYSYFGIVEYPETRPLSPIMPEGVTATTTDDYIEQYFSEYIMSPEKAINEEYSYGEFIFTHVNGIIRMLRETPNTNQAVINIGESIIRNGKELKNNKWMDTVVPKIYENPPCLRTITWQHHKGKLSISVFFRSWDVFAGLPTNLGGMQLLNEYIAMECGYETGQMYVYSSGAHCYETAKQLVEQRLGKKILEF